MAKIKDRFRVERAGGGVGPVLGLSGDPDVDCIPHSSQIFCSTSLQHIPVKCSSPSFADAVYEKSNVFSQ